MRVSEARVEITRFIKDCYRTGVRTALIIHGIGLKSQPRPGLLKSLVNQWLPDIENVLAFHTAQKISRWHGRNLCHDSEKSKCKTSDQRTKSETVDRIPLSYCGQQYRNILCVFGKKITHLSLVAVLATSLIAWAPNAHADDSNTEQPQRIILVIADGNGFFLI